MASLAPGGFARTSSFLFGSSCVSGGYNREFDANRFKATAYAKRRERRASRRNCLLYNGLGPSSATQPPETLDGREILLMYLLEDGIIRPTGLVEEIKEKSLSKKQYQLTEKG